MIDQNLIEACYHAFLGRAPESESVVQDTLCRVHTAEAILREFLDLPEFEARVLQQAINEQLPRWFDINLSEPSSIDVNVSDAQKEALFARLRRQWGILGEKNPFWSVLTYDEYRLSNLDENLRKKLYDTGADFARLVDAFSARSQVDIHRGVCLELGCGVGRVTKHLAKIFQEVIAIDISEGNLKQCEDMASRENIENIRCLLICSPEELEALGQFDFFFSTIALQHAPPPVQKYQLNLLLSKLRTGGGFLFQTQTYSPHYRFIVDDFLAAPLSTMDMHSLPMHEILMIIEQQELRLREVAADTFTGRPGSYTFFGLAKRAQKNGRGMASDEAYPVDSASRERH